MIESIEVVNGNGDRISFGSIVEPVTYTLHNNGSLEIEVKNICHKTTTTIFAPGQWKSVRILRKD